jgi:hypothetical protein
MLMSAGHRCARVGPAINSSSTAEATRPRRRMVEERSPMDRRSPARIIAGCFALCGFAVAVFASLGVGATVETILLRSIFGLVVCYIVGAIIGAVGERCIREGFETFAASHRAPKQEVFLVSPVGEETGATKMPGSGEKAS